MKTNEKLNPRWMKWLKKKKNQNIVPHSEYYLYLIILCKSLLLEKFLREISFFFFFSPFFYEKDFIIGTGIGNQKIFIPSEF